MLDLLILSKNEDGSVDALEIDDTPEVDAIRALEADVAEILAADDVELLSEAMEPGSFAGCSCSRTAGPPRSPPPPAGRAGS